MSKTATVLRVKGALEGGILHDYEFEITFFSIEDTTDYDSTEPVHEYSLTFETVLGAKISIPLSCIQDLTITNENVLETPF